MTGRGGRDEATTASVIEAAEQATAQRDWPRAVELWTTVMRSDDQTPDDQTYVRLAQALRNVGRPEDARRLLLSRLERGRRTARILAEVAVLAAKMEAWDEAQVAWNEVLAIRGDAAPPRSYLGLAVAFCHLGRLSEAAEVLDLGLERGAITRDQIPTRFEARSLFKAFAEQHALPIDPRRGASRKLDRYDVTVGAQRLRELQDHLDHVAPMVEGVAIRQLGWFGNSLIQLANALAVAEALHVDRLYVEPVWYLRTPATVSARTDHKILVTQGHDRGSEQDGPILEGRFLFDRSLAPLLQPHDDPFRYVRSLRPFTCFLPGPALPRDHLVIHVRAGDVFSGNDVNRRYGQPPLAYYLAVLDHDRWNTVDVVYEDLGNPVIAPLLEACRSRGLVTRSNTDDLSGTIDHLLRARNLVTGRGTFIPTIAALSENAERLYTFEGEVLPGFERWAVIPGVERYDVHDVDGGYRTTILDDNWRNSTPQRRLMLEYPLGHLRLRGSSA